MNQNYKNRNKILSNSQLVKSQGLNRMPLDEFIHRLYFSRLLENIEGKDIFQYIYFRYINKLKDYGLLWNFDYQFDQGQITGILKRVLKDDLFLYIKCIKQFYIDLLKIYPEENFLKEYVFPVIDYRYTTYADIDYTNTYLLVMIIIGTYLLEKYPHNISELLDCYKSDLSEMSDYRTPSHQYIANELFSVNNINPSKS
jgi:hypothetical protein